MDTSKVEFRPSLLAGDHKGFTAALSSDEYKQRRRLVTEAALTQLGSTTSAYSNFYPHAHRHRLRDITCDAEGPRRGFHPRLYNLLAGIAICGILVMGLLLLGPRGNDAQGVSASGWQVGYVLPAQSAVRSTVLELSRQEVEPGRFTEDAFVKGTADASDAVAGTPGSSSTGGSASQVHQPQPEQLSDDAAIGNLAQKVESVGPSVPEEKQKRQVNPATLSSPPVDQVELCTCSSSSPAGVCMLTALVDTTCMSGQQQQHAPQAAPTAQDFTPPKTKLPSPTRPSTQVLPQGNPQLEPQQQGSIHGPRTPQSSLEPHPAVRAKPGHGMAPAAPSLSALPSSLTPNAPPPALVLHGTAQAPPPTLPPTHGAAAAQVVGQLEALLASRSIHEFSAMLRWTAAQPHGALVMWIAVLTPLLSVFALCFTLSQALRLACVALSAMSTVCSASSHFSLQRLGALARQLIPATPTSSEEAILLELQAAMSQREADCRAKDEQLASLRQLLDGLQLELQRCSDAEDDLKVKYRKLLDATEATAGKHRASRPERSPSGTSTRSSLIPGPSALDAAQLSAPGSAFSDAGSDASSLARPRASPAAIPAFTPAPSPADGHGGAVGTPSAVPAPRRLGRVGAPAACAARSATAQGYAVGASTPTLSEAPSPSSDHSEAGFATCAASTPHSAAAALA